MTHAIKAGTPLHCNRNDCGATFPAPEVINRTPFGGAAAARTIPMITCPVCGRPDSHWVYVADVMPTFEGGFDARKRQADTWKRNN